MKRIILAFVVGAIVTGCAGCHDIKTVNLVDGAEKIRVFRKSDPPASCIEIQPFSVASGDGCGGFGSPGDFSAAYNTFRNKIYEMGGNAGLIQNEIAPHKEGTCFVNAYTINGIAFKCPVAALEIPK
jgi:hypothetical protein